MLRAIGCGALALVVSGCAGRNELEAPNEPWVLEAEPTVFADTRTNAAGDTVLTSEPNSEPTGAPTPTEPAIEPAASPLDSLTGDYRYSGGSSQRNSVASAIDDVADDMNALTRGVARSRLTKANKIPAHLEITTDGTTITVRLDGKAYTAKLGGSAVKIRDQGQSSRLRYELRGDSLYMFLDGADGDRTNVFTPRDDGKGVTMRVTMKSPKLPDTLGYRLSYRG
ncbi:MAG TPA: hypothetical protein VFG69_10905 [Nannocystaceae bacterium]|nr:hypothetical protein [Nannocystaceae bacterium]